MAWRSRRRVVDVGGSADREKSALRAEVLARCRALGGTERQSKSRAIHERVLHLPEFLASRAIHLYLSFRHEVQTAEIVRDALRSGRRVVVPVQQVSGGGLLLSELRDYPAEVAPGRWGIPEPKPEFVRPVSPEVVDLFILPGVAFDPSGNRLGYGKGYYDRLLAARRRTPAEVPLVALAFEVQVLGRLPAGLHDVRVHKIVTEDRVIDCKAEWREERLCPA